LDGKPPDTIPAGWHIPLGDLVNNPFFRTVLAVSPLQIPHGMRGRLWVNKWLFIKNELLWIFI
jgi:hypothetical protein